MIRPVVAATFLLATPCSHTPATAVEPSLLVVGLEAPTGRAATLRNAIAIHDGVRQQATNGSPTDTSPSPAGLSLVEPGRAGGVHPFWIWLARLGAYSGALLLAALCTTERRPSRWFPSLAVAVVACALLDIGLSLASSRQAASASAERLTRAEWRWRLDLARASAMPDDAAARVSLNAAQRYAADVASR